MSNHQTTDVDVAAAGDRNGIGQAVGDYFNRVRGGDVGSLPAVLGLVVLFLLFTALKPDTFFSFFNFANLLNQSAAIIVLAMGLVFVLLLGEIDLSAGFTAGTSAAVLAVALSSWGMVWPVALIIGLLTGTVIGLFIGTLVARLGIPSFVVTLAMFLALQGVMLLIIGEGGTIRLRSDVLLAIMNQNMPLWAGWVMWAVVVLGYALVSWRAISGRRRAGLRATATSVWVAKSVALALMMGVLVYVLNQQRQIVRPGKESCPVSGDAPVGCIPVIEGVPWAVLVVIVLVVGLTFVLSRTSFGRHVYAVGGNAEASRRSGINVKMIRIYCFMIGSTLAAVAGVLLASRDNSVSPTTGGAQTLLFAVGAAVIGGTSLFGGKGRVMDAVIGGLVIAVIANGLPLITQQSGIQFVVTGLVLLVAASVDAISRKRSGAG
ncbi:MAG TPA: ABC transporter permease [Actinobacteria bacterium]|jgi:D-xylose transport system permease protein|nr:ABC transporter permease [Actinomycetota bacterium]